MDPKIHRVVSFVSAQGDVPAVSFCKFFSLTVSIFKSKKEFLLNFKTFDGGLVFRGGRD